jgi:hypothetical protein
MQSIRQVFIVDREQISYLRFTLESYDGMAVVTTIGPDPGLIQISISPGCETMVLELLDSLKKDEGLRIKQVPKVNDRCA